MSSQPQPQPAAENQADPRPARGCFGHLRRFAPLAAVLILMAVVFAMGWHRELSPEALIKHRALIAGIVTEHEVLALLTFVALYIVAVALSVPAAWILTVSGGFLFGMVLGTLAAVTGATIGATIIFLIAKSAIGEHLVRRAGPIVEKLAEGFRADAFNYLLFMRLVPAFPFWLVNLVPALCGVQLRTFVAATALGIVPGGFAFAFFGTSLDDVIAEKEIKFQACVAAAGSDCRLTFGLEDVLKPKLIIAIVILCILALVPVILKRVQAGRKS